MNRDDVIRIARKAGFSHLGINVVDESVNECLQHFAALVAAAEREACAKVSDQQVERWVNDRSRYAASECASAIRARSQE